MDWRGRFVCRCKSTLFSLSIDRACLCMCKCSVGTVLKPVFLDKIPGPSMSMDHGESKNGPKGLHPGEIVFFGS